MQRDVYDWTLGQGVTIITAQQAHETDPHAVAAATMVWEYLALAGRRTL